MVTTITMITTVPFTTSPLTLLVDFVLFFLVKN